MANGIIQEVISIAEEHDLSYQWVEQTLIDKIRISFKDYDIDIIRMLIGDKYE